MSSGKTSPLPVFMLRIAVCADVPSFQVSNLPNNNPLPPLWMSSKLLARKRSLLILNRTPCKISEPGVTLCLCNQWPVSHYHWKAAKRKRQCKCTQIASIIFHWLMEEYDISKAGLPALMARMQLKHFPLNAGKIRKTTTVHKEKFHRHNPLWSRWDLSWS